VVNDCRHGDYDHRRRVFTFVESAAGIFHLNLMVPSLTTTFAGIFVCDWPQSGFPCEDYGSK